MGQMVTLVLTDWDSSGQPEGSILGMHCSAIRLQQALSLAGWPNDEILHEMLQGVTS